jgi:sulfite exporter TauE/SafE
MLAAAAGSHSVALGMAVMGGLGVGTSAVLLGIGVSGTLVDTRVRRIGLRGAGVIVMLVGVVTLLRPTGLLCRVLPASGLPVAAHEGRR